MMEKKTSNKGTKWKSRKAKGTKELYNHYKKHSDKPVSKKEWKEAVEMLNKEFMRLIIEEGKEMRMPHLSYLAIRKYSTVTPKSIDFQHYIKTGEKKLHKNTHSDGFQAKFHWRKKLCRIPGKSPYILSISRDNTRALAQELKKFNGHAKYIEYYGK